MLSIVAAAAAAPPPTPEERASRLAAELRCPVCQALSVKDSPSETARAMREVVAERIAEGRTDEEILAEFRGAYGDWVLLSPPPLDLRGLIWVVPLGAAAVGLAVALRRTRGGAPARPNELPPDAAAVAALRRRVALEESLDR